MKASVRFVVLLFSLLIPAASFAMEDGVYRDLAPGYGGDVIVRAVVRGGRIESIETENTGGEKSEYYLMAEKALSEAIIAANGLDGVDAVAGATGTSESILSAMRGILEQAAYTGALADDMKNAVQNVAEDVKNGADQLVDSVKEATLTPEPKGTV